MPFFRIYEWKKNCHLLIYLINQSSKLLKKRIKDRGLNCTFLAGD
ncbi:hypothetical protein DERP_007609, partial [Dermatophagoides pteronyssinus]